PPAAAAPPSTAVPAKAAAAVVPRGTSEPRPAGPVREITFETPRTRVIVTSEGAAVKSVQLLGDKWTRHKGAKEESSVDLVQPHAGEALPFSTRLLDGTGAELLSAKEGYEVVKQDAQSATLRAERGGV